MVTDSSASVLIVDESSECREVLRTALERRGLRIFEAAAPEAGLALAREHSPNLIVVDTDTDREATVVKHAHRVGRDTGGTQLVLLGSVRRLSGRSGQFVVKPYHYAPLILKIEQLVAESRREVARGG